MAQAAVVETAEVRGTSECLTFYVGEQIFGILVARVQDVLADYSISPIPLAPAEVLGSLNLRGRIVTAIDVRRRLRLPAPEEQLRQMSIVTFHGDDLYSFIVDRVGDVIALDPRTFEANPPTMKAHLQELSHGVFRLKDSLLILLDVDKLAQL